MVDIELLSLSFSWAGIRIAWTPKLLMVVFGRQE